MWNFRLQAEAERSSLLLTQRGTSLFRAAFEPAGDGVRDRPDEVDESDEERGGDRQHRDQRQRAAGDALGEHTAHTAFRCGQLRPIHRTLR